MSYSRNAYIIVGTTSRHEWEDFAAAIVDKALNDPNAGAAAVVGRSDARTYLESTYIDLRRPNVVAVVKVDMEDVMRGASFEYLHDFVWATHQFGNPGKINVLGHGSLTACIGARPASDDYYLEVPQRTFVRHVLPDWPLVPPDRLNFSPSVVQGLKVIALRQCFAARTDRSYVTRATFNSYEAAHGSAVTITVDELRSKGWAGSGVTVTASPQYNVFNTGSAEITMGALMPRVKGMARSVEITLPKEHEVYLDHGRAHIRVPITTWKGLLRAGDVVRIDGHSWWHPEPESSVTYPDHWLRERKASTWRITLPEYVVADPLRNKIGILKGTPKRVRILDDEQVALQQNPLKIRIQL